MSLVLKMKLQSTTVHHADNPAEVRCDSYELSAVSGAENAPWSKWTPSGRLTFTVTNPDAPKLEPGEYLVTLTKV